MDNVEDAVDDRITSLTRRFDEQNVEQARSARSTASTGPIVTVRITLISDPDTRIDGALMAASLCHVCPYGTKHDQTWSVRIM